jgi:dihydroorotate dehydrogenase
MIYEKFLKPLLFKLDPETAHELACSFLPALAATIPTEHNPFIYKSPRLKTNLLGMTLDSPLGLAAGFDKNARYINALAKLGFSFLEIGSVQTVATRGSPRPRLFRLPEDQALINRLGLNGEGAQAVAQRLADHNCPLPIGINISKTNNVNLKGDAAIEDVLHSFKTLCQLPVAYITINISCPNTEEGRLQETKESSLVLEEIQKINDRQLPVLVKLSPDSPDHMLDDIVHSAIKTGIKGYVCGNTTIRRDILHTASSTVSSIGAGGVSGRPLKPLALELTRKVCRLKSPEQIVIGVGGILSGQDILDFLSTGAVAVQAYTGFVYRGPTFCKQACRELDDLLADSQLSVSGLTARFVDI